MTHNKCRIKRIYNECSNTRNEAGARGRTEESKEGTGGEGGGVKGSVSGIERQMSSVSRRVPHVIGLFILGRVNAIQQLGVPAHKITNPASICPLITRAHLASSSERLSLREGVTSPVSTERSMGRMENF